MYFFLTAFLMVCKCTSILDAVPVNCSGDDWLRSAHAHISGLPHRPEVQCRYLVMDSFPQKYLEDLKIRREEGWRSSERGDGSRLLVLAC